MDWKCDICKCSKYCMYTTISDHKCKTFEIGLCQLGEFTKDVQEEWGITYGEALQMIDLALRYGGIGVCDSIYNAIKNTNRKKD